MSTATMTIEEFAYSDRSAGDRNADLLAAQHRARRGPTPEAFYSKHIDNSRLRKAPDPQRTREIRTFSLAMIVLFAMVMVYVWQHFSAIEYGYKIEAQKQQVDQLNESMRQLQLQEDTLLSPSRLDAQARAMGLDAPQPGQLRDDSADGAPVFAKASLPGTPTAQ
jgi:cell division protein FtsL